MSSSDDGAGAMHSPPHSQTTIVLRPIGSSLPLGFFAFAVGMLILACQATGWIPVAEEKDGAMILIAFVFPLELVATVFAFLARDTLGATTLGLFATSWLTFGWLAHSAPPGSTSVTLGIYLFGFATAVLLLSTLSTLGKPFFSALLLLAAARMILAGLYEVGAAGKPVYEASGWIGLVLSALAMYGGAALGLEDAHQRDVLPLFRRKAAAASFAGYEHQLERLEAEAGVRQQL
jgi:succinate-acetate transporter protein